MCMNMGVSRQQSTPFVSRSVQGGWRHDLSPAHLLRRGALVPMEVAFHQLPISYDPVSRRIIGTQADELYRARRALRAERNLVG